MYLLTTLYFLEPVKNYYISRTRAHETFWCSAYLNFKYELVIICHNSSGYKQQ